jgi:hypothetical protein
MADIAPGFTLRTGRDSVAASASPAALRAFVAAANEARRIEGLPDAMNPAYLDADKVAALAAGLSTQPAAVLSRLAGHELLLDEPGLQVRTAFPSRPDAFASFALEILDIQGSVVSARVTAAPDATLASTRATDAQARLGPIGQEIDRLQAVSPVPFDALRLAREQRQAVARVWRMNALAWQQAAPNDASAAAAATAADAAARAAALPPRGGTVP